MTTALLLTFAAMLGLAIGSFLNVVISRVPDGESITGRSHCPKCGTAIAPYDNIPVLSWLILRGKCRHCGAAISAQYIGVEALTAGLFTLTVAQYGVTVLTATLLVFLSYSIALAVIDYQTMRLPDSLTLPLLVSTAVALTVNSGITGDWGSLGRAAIAAVALTAGYGLLYVATRGRGIGFGDVKLAPTLAAVTAYLGWGIFAVGIVAGWIIGATIAVVGLAAGRVRLGKPLPFGPSLLAGTWVAVLVGQPMWGWYQQFLPAS